MNVDSMYRFLLSCVLVIRGISLSLVVFSDSTDNISWRSLCIFSLLNLVVVFVVHRNKIWRHVKIVKVGILRCCKLVIVQRDLNKVRYNRR